MKIGYARVSTIEQNLDLQLQALKKAGCQKIYREKVSGATRQRPLRLRKMVQPLAAPAEYNRRWGFSAAELSVPRPVTRMFSFRKVWRCVCSGYGVVCEACDEKDSCKSLRKVGFTGTGGWCADAAESCWCNGAARRRTWGWRRRTRERRCAELFRRRRSARVFRWELFRRKSRLRCARFFRQTGLRQPTRILGWPRLLRPRLHRSFLRAIRLPRILRWGPLPGFWRLRWVSLRWVCLRPRLRLRSVVFFRPKLRLRSGLFLRTGPRAAALRPGFI